MRLQFGWTLWFTFTVQLSAGNQPSRGNPLAGGGGLLPPLRAVRGSSRVAPSSPDCDEMGRGEGGHCQAVDEFTERSG